MNLHLFVPRGYIQFISIMSKESLKSDSETANQLVAVPTKPEEEPLISLGAFFGGTGAVFALGLLYGIRRSFKQEDLEIQVNNKLLNNSKNLSPEAIQKLKIQSLPLSGSPFAFLTRNKASATLAFRAFMIGSALCFSTFFLGGSVFMYANNLNSTDDLKRYMQNRMQNSVLGKMIHAPDDNPEETAEIEKWLEEVSSNPWKLLDPESDRKKDTTNKAAATTPSSTPTPNQSTANNPEEPIDPVTAVILYKWNRLKFKVGLGEDPGPPPITK